MIQTTDLDLEECVPYPGLRVIRTLPTKRNRYASDGGGASSTVDLARKIALARLNRWHDRATPFDFTVIAGEPRFLRRRGDLEVC